MSPQPKALVPKRVLVYPLVTDAVAQLREP